MYQFLLDFDPITFLAIPPESTNSLSQKDLESLQKGLFNKISEYVFLQITEELTEEQGKEISMLQSTDLLSKLEIYIPELDKKIERALDEFKQAYQIR